MIYIEVLYLIKLQLRIWREKEDESEKRVVVFKNFKDKIVIEWE